MDHAVFNGSTLTCIWLGVCEFLDASAGRLQQDCLVHEHEQAADAAHCRS